MAQRTKSCLYAFIFLVAAPGHRTPDVVIELAGLVGPVQYSKILFPHKLRFVFKNEFILPTSVFRGLHLASKNFDIFIQEGPS